MGGKKRNSNIGIKRKIERSQVVAKTQKINATSSSEEKTVLTDNLMDSNQCAYTDSTSNCGGSGIYGKYEDHFSPGELIPENETAHSDPELVVNENKSVSFVFPEDTSLAEFGDSTRRMPVGEEELEDILADGSLVKKVIKGGLGRESRPHHGDVVVINYKGWLEDGTLVEDCSDCRFALGDGDTIHAFDVALPMAQLKEVFELTVESRFAFGSLGREPDIPADAKLRYVIQLVSVEDPPVYGTMSITERMTAADRKRDRGNYYFRREEYTYALESYSKALTILTSTDFPLSQPADSGDLPDDLSNTSVTFLDELEMKLLNNLALTQLKVKTFDAALHTCDQVLLKSPGNAKALFRKAQALMGLEDADRAIPILTQLLHKVPSSQVFRSELQKAQAVSQQQRERWSRTVKRLFRDEPHPPKSRFHRFRSAMVSWKKLLLSATVLALLSIGLVYYTDGIPPILTARFTSYFHIN